jgi:superoxide reductase
MAKYLEVYKCEVCGNIVEVFEGHEGDLVCCGEDMVLLEEKTADKTVEKHVPYIEETDDGYKVKVGKEVAHPMTEEHYIQWIELVAGDKVYRQMLNPGDAPEACFSIEKTDGVYAREHCNIHGLWKG